MASNFSGECVILPSFELRKWKENINIYVSGIKIYTIVEELYNSLFIGDRRNTVSHKEFLPPNMTNC